ncbi:MAG: SUMF1/EgtB/PvdO family nonheme iron enzyme [Anaerolineales bacterium]|nr:SUMF1/EgtB/PvdO family nonheme iron enzyme [Anaerolineales bacterium]
MMKRWSILYLALLIVAAGLLLLAAACTGGRQPEKTELPPVAPAVGEGDVEGGAGGKLPSNPKDGDTWISDKDGMVLVYVSAGDFMMGAREFDEQAEPDEIPMRTVTLDGFWIDKTEITNEMFAAFLTEQGNKTEGGGSWYQADSSDAKILVVGPKWQAEEGYEDRAVVEVTWFGAKAYCEWAERSLPTEAQWEKAARGTEGLIFPWGDSDPNCSLANFFTGSQSCAGGIADVGAYSGGASPYGALDMAGNVWEWVADWYKSNYYENIPAENPTGPDSGSNKVFRGGSFESGPRTLRASERNSDEPGVARYRIGFRCVLNP